jgi:hypothetical protein
VPAARTAACILQLLGLLHFLPLRRRVYHPQFRTHLAAAPACHDSATRARCTLPHACPCPSQEFELMLDVDRLIRELDKESCGAISYKEFKLIFS